MTVMNAKIIFITVIVSSVISQTSTTLKGGNNAVCTRLVSFMRSQSFTSLKKYRKDEGNIFSPIKIRTKFTTAYDPALVIEQICCSGYENKNGTCEPQCLSSCENGYCAQPNTCACNYGYQQNLYGNVSVCEPTCEGPCTSISANVATYSESSRITRSLESPGSTQSSTSESHASTENQNCLNGKYLAPGKCTCNSGFLYNSTTSDCDPFCTKPCKNGTCVSPEKCECFKGYAETSKNSNACEPVCKNCVNGFCDAPDKCDCNPGFLYNSTTSGCDPFCTKPCENGTCVSPEKCECFEGYAETSKNSNACEPVCENCDNGFCKAPGKCDCSPGFTKDKKDNQTCVASCKPECINGMCSAMGCVCDCGWGGDSCGESLLCFVNQSSQGIISKTERNILKSNVSCNVTTEKPQMNLRLPACRPACHGQLGSIPVNLTQNTTDEIYYYIRIDSSCNLGAVDLDSSQRSRTVIGAVLGILLSGTIVCAAYFATKKLVKINRLRRSESRQRLYPDYVELNSNDGEDQHILS